MDIKAPDDRSQWYLEAMGDESSEWMVAIEPFPFIIGRDEECSLKLTAKWVSRRHAEIRRSGNHLWIRDTGSTNGTYVNNREIIQAELLEQGDIISIGKTRFLLKKAEFTVSDMAEATFSLDMPENFNSLATFKPKLQELLRTRNVKPHFQPVLNFSDMALVGYEILGRINDPELPENPSELLDIAEWLGCATDLSALFREVGIEHGKDLPGTPLLFVNTAPMETSQMGILVKSMERLHAMASGSKIVLEINEKAATDTDGMVRLRDALNQMSIGLAFDDFGVGQTRLLELAKAPPDFLKFDMSIIRQIHLAPQRLHQMVSTFVKAAQDLGIATLAEGIECSDEAVTCQQLGFNFAQGFLYGKPLPINEILMKNA